jgi:hypothetical protein
VSTGSLLLAFVGVKVALAVLFWRASVRGFALAERIEARKRAEAAARAAAPDPAPSRVSRPAA